MIKSNYWDLKHPEEGFKWFEINLPIPAQRHQEPFIDAFASDGVLSYKYSLNGSAHETEDKAR